VNAETLYAIAAAVRADLKTTQIDTLTQQLQVALEGQVAAPGDPVQQQAVAEAAKVLRGALSTSTVDRFSPAWRSALEEMGVSGLLGSEFRTAIDEIFLRNQITPSVALEEIRALSQRLAQLHGSIDQLTSALDYFHVKTLELEPGETEVGFTIPRGFVYNDLRSLGLEFERLNRILGPFNELGIGERPQISIRTISSSDFTVLVTLLPRAAVVFASSVTWLQHTYKQMLDARLIKRQLEEMEFSTSTSSLIEEEASGKMMTAIGSLADELISKYGNEVSELRIPELKMDLKASLTDISKRIDIGMNFEIRAADTEPPRADASPEEVESQLADEQRIQEIRNLASSIEHFELGGSAILGIAEGGFGNEDQDNAHREDG
jgi:hypothetical protein